MSQGLWRRGLYAAAGVLAAALLFLAGGRLMLRALERQLIYFPTRESSRLPLPQVLGASSVEEVWLETSDGVRVHAIYASREGALAELLFFHGNAGNLYDRLENVGDLVETGFNVLIIDYRGYGKSDGEPSEAGLYRDAAAAYEHLTVARRVEPSRIVLFGRSLGSAVAIELAAGERVGALIVESGFTTARGLARLHYGWIPDVVLRAMTHEFDSLGKVPGLRSPALYVHGSADMIVPARMGRQLFEASAEPKEWYEIAGAGHNDTWLLGGRAYYRRLADFVASHLGGGDR